MTSLLLCLAGRLARMEGEEGEEANTKRTKLLEQLEERKRAWDDPLDPLKKISLLEVGLALDKYIAIILLD